MSITYTWTFGDCAVASSVEVDGTMLNNVVMRVPWTVTATDGVNSTTRIDETSLSPPDPQSYVPFSNLTPDIVKAWIFGIVGDIEGSLANELAAAAASQPSLTSMALPF